MLTIALTILLLLALAVAAAYASPTPVRIRSGRETQWDDPMPARYQRSGVDMDDLLRALGGEGL